MSISKAFIFSLMICALNVGCEGCDPETPTPDVSITDNCLSDSECEDDEVCDEGECVRVQDECDSQADCLPSENCLDGVCTENPNCTNDDDCPGTQRCEQGQCVVVGECEDDDDCGPEATCDENGDCIRNPSCEDDSQCEDNFECNENGICVERPLCEDEGDCGAAFTCVDGNCFPRPDCLEQSDCGEGAECIDGECIRNDSCDGDDDCPLTQECVDDVCTDRAGCLELLDCATDEVCTDGVCVAAPTCTEDDDCPASLNCQQGECVRNPGCEDDTDCPGTQSCEDEVCTRNEDCTVTGDCPADQFCSEGVCTNNPACTQNADCPQSEACIDGACTRLGECVVDADCGGGGRACDENGLCVRISCRNDDECSDGKFCNGVETCDIVDGCQQGVAPAIDDGIACTEDSCDEVNNTVVNTPINSICNDNNLCTTDICEPAVGCVLLPNDDAIPLQGPQNDCIREVCRNGVQTNLAADDEIPPQGVDNDCLAEVCSAGQAVQAAADDEVPPQGPLTDCVAETCSGGVVTNVAANDEIPPQGPENDCLEEVCLAGAATSIPKDTEIPTEGPDNDCVTEQCQNGVITLIAADGETPPQGPVNDCVQERCQGGAVVNFAADDEVPPQGPDSDCKDQICSGGAVQDVDNDNEIPTPDGTECRVGECRFGEPFFVGDDDICVDTFDCTVGTCRVDGGCQQTPDDSLCQSCPPDNLAQCAPEDANADAAGCICLPEATLACSVTPTVGEVLAPFSLSATANGGSFVWTLTGVPLGADPGAQIFVPDDFTATFSATSPSANNVADYEFTGTLTRDDGNIETCVVAVEAKPLPDDIVVTLFMQDDVDVDLHVIGGSIAGNQDDLQFDIPFHPDFDQATGSNPARDCYFQNCPVCTAQVDGQPDCTPTNPREVDFARPANGAALTDLEDPQLDIDNRRGCFDTVDGEVCIPEKITIEEPESGTYFVWSYLFGESLATEAGLASVPTATDVTLEIRCRGVTKTYTRSLDSLENGVVEPSRSLKRLGGANGFVKFEVPAAGPCVLP